uniref:Protein IMPACT homolog n=1 Tax=Crassostrea virginica TaxID=6565 RepID=A0A8B8AIL1_CRAVI|nr:protein IMPACT homolog [Crassostrea virginica]
MAQNVFAKGSQRKSVSYPSSTVTPAFGITGEVSSALQSLPIMQQSLQDIQHRLNGLDEVRLELQGVKEGLREDLWGDDGLPPKIQYVAQQTEETGQNLETIMKENKSLRQELELLKSVNGNVYKDKVLVPRAEDVLLALDEDKEALGHIEVVTSEKKREKGNRFIANAAEAKTYGDVRKFYKKICSIPIHAQASHRILVNRSTDKDGKLIDGYMDDGEYGAGRNLLKHLEERRLNNVVCVVTRWYGGEHLGGMRFELMKDVATEEAQRLNP